MNRYNAKEFLPLVQALADGKTIQWGSDGKWFDHEDVIFSDELSSYRVKPEPKLRAWKPEEVPVGALVAWKGTTRASVILGINCDGELVTCNGKWDGYGALRTLDHSTDGGKTWKSCGVEE